MYFYGKPIKLRRHIPITSAKFRNKSDNLKRGIHDKRVFNQNGQPRKV